eukprot:GHVS01007508.1.p1 GENE.GHVS01007508.1~~GHVS01007508.1.p1  ORF type:complete len:121 (+),score=13.81 GHVS01007508.1:180-542(+)
MLMTPGTCRFNSSPTVAAASQFTNVACTSWDKTTPDASISIIEHKSRALRRLSRNMRRIGKKATCSSGYRIAILCTCVSSSGSSGSILSSSVHWQKMLARVNCGWASAYIYIYRFLSIDC